MWIYLTGFILMLLCYIKYKEYSNSILKEKKTNHICLQVPDNKWKRELQEYPEVQKRLLQIIKFLKFQNFVFLYFIIIYRYIHKPPIGIMPGLLFLRDSKNKWFQSALSQLSAFTTFMLTGWQCEGGQEEDTRCREEKEGGSLN